MCLNNGDIFPNAIIFDTALELTKEGLYENNTCFPLSEIFSLTRPARAALNTGGVFLQNCQS
jgi:hypothetical protein